jgi:hypothetical protein
MIVVDGSVWIDHLNDVATGQVASLRRLIGEDVLRPVLVGELMLFEVLSGLRARRR